MRQTGVVTNWHDDRGFGFIKADDGGPDLFLHARDFNNGLVRPLKGMTVDIEAQTAVTVKGVNVTVSGSAMTQVSSSGITTVKGSLVNIN